jgi:hypothetical protein
LETLKEALKPHDARVAGDRTHDGRHGGAAETMIPGHQDYDDESTSRSRGGTFGSNDPHRDASSGGGSGTLDNLMPGQREHRSTDGGGSFFEMLKPSGKLRGSDGADNTDSSTLDKVKHSLSGSRGEQAPYVDTKATGAGNHSDENYTYDKYPATGSAVDPETSLAGSRDAGMLFPRKSLFEISG